LVSTGVADELMAVTAGLRRLVRRRLRTELPGPMLRGAQVEVLKVVEDQPGIGVAAAARQLHLAANSVSTLVNQLADAGMLRKQTDPDDRRAVRLRLTPAAQRRLARWREARTRLVIDGLERLDTRDVEAVEQALPALRRLLAAVAEQEESST
jgi:DNA-binding MarR family transcriptional regulator